MDINWKNLWLFFAIFILITVFFCAYKNWLEFDSVIIAVCVGLAIAIIAPFISSDNKERVIKLKGILDKKIKSIKENESKISHLSSNRKKEIVEKICNTLPHFISFRNKYFSKNTKKPNKSKLKRIMQEPAWYSLANTNSESGYRFMMGFKNKGCSYWTNDPYKLGCFACGYCSGIIPDVEPSNEELLKQFDAALSAVLETDRKFDVIEFLNDGSFFESVHLKIDKKVAW